MRAEDEQRKAEWDWSSKWSILWQSQTDSILTLTGYFRRPVFCLSCKPCFGKLKLFLGCLAKAQGIEGFIRKKEGKKEEKKEKRKKREI